MKIKKRKIIYISLKMQPQKRTHRKKTNWTSPLLLETPENETFKIET